MKTYFKKIALFLFLALCFSFTAAFCLDNYTNEQGNFQVSYDILLWEIETRGSDVRIKIIPERVVPPHKFDNEAGVMIFSKFLNKDLDCKMLTEADSAQKFLSQSWLEPNLISTNKVALGAQEAVELIFTFISNGIKNKAKEYFLSSKGYNYIILAAAEEKDFSAVEKYFDKIISSFKTLR